MTAEHYDYVLLTSPEAAMVFIDGWRDAGKPAVRIATVGAGTSRVLLAGQDAAALAPVFEPTKANAVHLSAELPEVPGGNKRVLYPASVKAGTDLQVGVLLVLFTNTHPPHRMAWRLGALSAHGFTRTTRSPCGRWTMVPCSRRVRRQW